MVVCCGTKDEDLGLCNWEGMTQVSLDLEPSSVFIKGETLSFFFCPYKCQEAISYWDRCFLKGYPECIPWGFIKSNKSLWSAQP